VLAAGLAGTALGLAGGRHAAGTTPPTEPPEAPTGEDRARLAAAQSLELAARDLYQAVIDGGLTDPVFVAIRDNHRAYADNLSGLIGRSAPGRPDAALHEEMIGAFEDADTTAAASAAYDLESRLVATHTESLRQLEGTDGARMVASILIVESRHCAVLADLAGGGDDVELLFENAAEPIAVGESEA
jgi:hypothetical protein